MSYLRLALRLALYPIVFLLGLAAIGISIAAMVFILVYPGLPSLEALTDYRPKIPLRVYSADGRLIGEFGEERRAVVKIGEVPSVMKQAILAAEDDRFYQHPGIDAMGVMRAALANLSSISKKQGASTITQQVARNFFLTSERSYTRKFYEILLSFKIENNLSKDQILELYVNQIFLGQRAYGFAAASKIYFGKELSQLSIAEAAMLAGLPKAPSTFNPVVNPKRARIRQLYVLKRMLDLEYISEKEFAAAKEETLVVKRDLGGYAEHAEFVAEMARQIAAERFPESDYPRDFIYTHGLKVYTTINYEEQEAAYQSLRRGVLDYDRRHGFRGAEAYVDMTEISSDQDENIDLALEKVPQAGDLIPALVLAANTQQIRLYPQGGEIITLTGAQLKWAARMLDDKAPPNKRLKRGAITRVQKDEKGQWQIAQLPEVESAFVSVDPRTGAVRTLIGGFDFNRNKFNHVTQAWRQPGSSFKPFIYSASLEKGYSPSSVIADEPIIIPGSQTGGQDWEPQNYDNKYEGPMMMRKALAKSKNMVSIRILQAIGTQYAQDYTTRFGFDADKHPPYLTMALGAGSVTPWQMVTAYSVFANGGFKLQPYVVSSIRNVIAAMPPPPSGDEAMRAIDARNAFLMDSMLRDVTIYGTAARASATLKRQDLAGKTGTTNDYLDAWFCGYQKTVSACAWVGFDQPKKLGDRETGGAVALPIWIGYMKVALKDVAVSLPEAPGGLVPSGPGKEMIYVENLNRSPEGGETGEKSEDCARYFNCPPEH
ncbi:MAG: Penicillin-binding protein 1A [Betaproteobacteria bacterium ADurb.Bin341]|nr:MAG: Penicillin-binding protein 1A [Betaproteobacteria bacterium ADurb.Bin341]